METVKFEWNHQKALSNLKKHEVSFDEAKTIFSDEKALIIHDPEHSFNEDRFIILGLSSNTRLLVVCHCYQLSGNTIRLISARKATKRESIQYRGKIL